uniref:C2H2-type domain-containing protein n=1 Tax=Dicentrarchus labrax TaxID=13489 RepID=A0A8P4K8L8_DICLA
MAKVELKTNDRINIDFCRQIRQLQTGPNHLKNEGVSISDPSFNTDKKPFSSFTCDRRSEDGHTLQRHKKCHTGEKKFSCLFCEKEFVTGGHLTRHISVHIGEKILSCIVCEKAFTLESELISHECVHQSQTVEQMTANNLSEHMAPPHIKEEQEEVGISQEGEQLQGFTFTPVPVKSEDDDDDEEKPPSSQLHQRQTEQMETEADGDTDNSVDSDFWKETRERPSGLNSLNNDEISESVTGCDPGNQVLSCSDDKASESLEPESDNSTDSDFWKDDRKPQESSRKPHGCSECGRRFRHVHHLKIHMKFHAGKRATFFCSVCGLECLYKSHLKIHMRTHTGEKPFGCPVCGKKYAHKASMQSHMVIHTVEKQYTCNACDKGFAWYTELKYHQCVGEASNETAKRNHGLPVVCVHSFLEPYVTFF